MTVTVNPYLQGQFRTRARGGDGDRAARHRQAARGPQRPLTAQRAQPRHGPRTLDLPLVHRRRHGARDQAPRPAGRVVPNRWVRSAEVARTLGEEPRPGPVHAGMDFAPNTNVIGHAGRTFAIVEAGALPYELTDELEMIGPCDFGGTLDGGYTAHPKRDPLTGELYAVSYFFGWGDDVGVTVMDARPGCAPRGRRDGRARERARHRDHRTLHRPTRSPRDVQPGGGGVRCELPVPLAGGVPLPDRPAPPRWRVDRCGLARHRAARRVQPHERLRRAWRRRDRARRRSPSVHVPHLAPGPQRGVTHAGALAPRRPRGRGQGGATRRPRADSPVSTSAASACPIGMAMRLPSASRGHPRHRIDVAAPRPRERDERGPFLRRGTSLGQAVFVPRAGTPTRPTAGCCCSCIRPTPAPPPCTSSTPVTWGAMPRPSSICRNVCRRDSTATGCPTRLDRARPSRPVPTRPTLPILPHPPCPVLPRRNWSRLPPAARG